MNQDYYQEQQDQAQKDFWTVCHRLVQEGIVDIKSHPDYIAADQRCLKASDELVDGSPDE